MTTLTEFGIQAPADKSAQEVFEDISYLRDLHEPRRHEMRKIRDIVDGGPEGIAALLGDSFSGSNPPVNHLMYSGLSRLAQKLGLPPDLKVPANRDNETQRKSAEVRERIVHGYDEGCRLEMQLPQVGRWLPGYGFAAWTISDGFDASGNPFPNATLRDPYGCFPSSWGVTQQPDRMAIVREMDIRKARRLFPMFADKLTVDPHRMGGGVLLGSDGKVSWEGNTARMVSVVEYIDEHGTWTMVPENDLMVDFTPNPMAPVPAFVVAKRFSFNKLNGHYDHIIGLMAANARLNLMTLIAMEDAVFAERVIIGETAQGNNWNTGRDATNYLQPGSSAMRMPSSVNPQMFQEIDRLERQLRTTANYPVMDDAQSPNSFVTGRGLDNLSGGVDKDVAEYQTVLRYALQDLDERRLRWDFHAYGAKKRPLWGKGSKQEYSAREDIAEQFSTRRMFGVMAGWDDPSMIVSGLQLLQGGIIDTLTMQENIRGLDDVTEVRRRISQEQAESALMQAMLASSQQGDPKAVMALIEMLPSGELKTKLQKFYTAEGPEMSPEEQQLAGAPQEPQDTTTALSRLLSSGETQGGIQTVGTL